MQPNELFPSSVNNSSASYIEVIHECFAAGKCFDHLLKVLLLLHLWLTTYLSSCSWILLQMSHFVEMISSKQFHIFLCDKIFVLCAWIKSKYLVTNTGLFLYGTLLSDFYLAVTFRYSTTKMTEKKLKRQLHIFFIFSCQFEKASHQDFLSDCYGGKVWCNYTTPSNVVMCCGVSDGFYGLWQTASSCSCSIHISLLNNVHPKICLTKREKNQHN